MGVSPTLISEVTDAVTEEVKGCRTGHSRRFTPLSFWMRCM